MNQRHQKKKVALTNCDTTSFEKKGLRFPETRTYFHISFPKYTCRQHLQELSSNSICTDDILFTHQSQVSTTSIKQLDANFYHFIISKCLDIKVIMIPRSWYPEILCLY
jgi:hypothetical protein